MYGPPRPLGDLTKLTRNIEFLFIAFLGFFFLAQSAAVSQPENQTAEHILASVKPEDVKNIVNKVADEVLGNFKVCFGMLFLVLHLNDY